MPKICSIFFAQLDIDYRVEPLVNTEKSKQTSPSQLIYCYDPMCSWCWGFKNTWEALKSMLLPSVDKGELVIRPMLGGLAVDSDVPMPMDMRSMLQSTWQRIESQLGTKFNYDFWHDCAPRRSTYPACRACIVARDKGLEIEMNEQIQQSYYLKAKNPSDMDTLSECAEQIGMRSPEFVQAMENIKANNKLEEEVQLARSMGLTSFPSLTLLHKGKLNPIEINYQSAEDMLVVIQEIIAS